jgi:uncharacterized membrane protein
MPNIAALHPQIVHFVIALAFVGVILRLVAFTPWFAFANVAARTLILVSAVAGVLAVKSGDEAHGPAERVPGARDAVVEHEEHGERARTILLVVAALELIGWAAARKQPKVAKGVLALAAAAGVVALYFVYEAAEHGGEVVYSYAGNVGIRSGDAEDVTRLLIAGLYHQAQADRRAGRREDAARLFDEMARRRPDDAGVRLLAIESRIHDRGDGRGGLAALDSLGEPPGASPRTRAQLGHLRADAYLALGLRDSARVTLEALAAALPDNPRIRARLDSLR